MQPTKTFPFYGFLTDVTVAANCVLRKHPTEAGLLVDLYGQECLGLSTSGLFIHTRSSKDIGVFYVRPEMDGVQPVNDEFVGPLVKVQPKDFGEIKQGSLVLDYENTKIVVPYEFGEMYLAMLDLLYEKAWDPVESQVMFFNAFLNRLENMTGRRLDLGVLSVPQRLEAIGLYHDYMKTCRRLLRL